MNDIVKMQGDSAEVTCLHPFGELGLKRIQICKNNMGHVQQAGLNPEFGVVTQDRAPGLRDTQKITARCDEKYFSLF